MSKIKKIAGIIALFLSIHLSVNAQISSGVITIAPSISIEIKDNKKVAKEGEILVLKAKGGDERSAFQWQTSMDNKTWVNIPKATGDVFETFPIVQNTFFRVVCKPIDADAMLVESISNVEAVSLAAPVATTKKPKD